MYILRSICSTKLVLQLFKQCSQLFSDRQIGVAKYMGDGCVHHLMQNSVFIQTVLRVKRNCVCARVERARLPFTDRTNHDFGSKVQALDLAEDRLQRLTACRVLQVSD